MPGLKGVKMKNIKTAFKNENEKPDLTAREIKECNELKNALTHSIARIFDLKGNVSNGFLQECYNIVLDAVGHLTISLTLGDILKAKTLIDVSGEAMKKNLEIRQDEIEKYYKKN